VSSSRRIVLLLALGVLGACASTPRLTYTDDGTPIVPYDSRAEAHSTLVTGSDQFELALSAWTDRMPSGRRRAGDTVGFPLHVALSVRVLKTTHPDSILMPALTLWSPDGDSMLVTLPLIRVDGKDPWVAATDSGQVTELTDRRDRPGRRFTVDPEPVWQPRLLIMDGGRTRFLTLPAARIEAAY